MSSARSSSGGQKANVERTCYHNVLVVGAAGRSTPCLLSQTLGPHAIMGPPHPLSCWLMPLPWLKRICMLIKVSHNILSSTECAQNVMHHLRANPKTATQPGLHPWTSIITTHTSIRTLPVVRGWQERGCSVGKRHHRQTAMLTPMKLIIGKHSENATIEHDTALKVNMQCIG